MAVRRSERRPDATTVIYIIIVTMDTRTHQHMHTHKRTIGAEQWRHQRLPYQQHAGVPPTEMNVRSVGKDRLRWWVQVAHSMHTYASEKVSRLPWQHGRQSRVWGWTRLDRAFTLHICVIFLLALPSALWLGATVSSGKQRVIHVLFFRRSIRLWVDTSEPLHLTPTSLVVTTKAVYLLHCQATLAIIFYKCRLGFFLICHAVWLLRSGQTSSCRTPRAVTYAGSENYGSETGQMASLPHSTEIKFTDVC